MNIPKYSKSRRSGTSSTHEDHWKSFTDVFATVCLMFFFVLVVFGVLTTYLNNETQVKTARLDERETELLLTAKALELLRGELDEAETRRLELEEETLRQQMSLEELRASFLSDRNRQIREFNEASAQFDKIALYRVNMYRKIESMLKEFLGDDVYYDEEARTLVINANFLFSKNSAEVRESDKETINKISNVLFRIIDEYTDPASDNLVRFKHFEIQGHTDLDGTTFKNRQLSLDRAESIVNQFLPMDSAAERKYGHYFIASGASEFMPIAGTVSQQSDAQMDLNRRVEIISHFDDKDIERQISDIAATILTPTATDDPFAPDDWDNTEQEDIYLPPIPNNNGE